MADAVVAVMDGTVVTPKKKPRPQRKTKNDPPKNNVKKHEPVVVKSVTRVEEDVVDQATYREGSKNATPEKKNMGQYGQQKKKINNSQKKKNANKASNPNSAPQSPQVKEDASRLPPPNLHKLIKEEKKLQMDLYKRQVEEERRKRWYHHFMNKPNDLITLDRNKIILLKLMDKGKPHAQFLCKVCNYYCDTLPVVVTHVRKPTHRRMLQDYSDEMTLRELPDLTREQLAVLNSYLNNVVAENGLNPSDLESRRTISVLVSDLVTTNLKGCSVRLFGSSIHGLGLKTADVNIDLQVPDSNLSSVMLKEVAALLGTSQHFVDVVENFNCEFPYVSFKYKKNGEQCSVSLNNERAVSLTTLLSKYTPLDPRLTQLAALFRLWGQLTGTDKPQEGTWPGYAFYLLTVFYLQQCNDPVLPVLNDLLVEKGESESANTIKVLSMSVNDIKKKWRTQNKQNLAALWIGLLKFYTIDFNYTEYIVSIDSLALIPRKTRKLFIVDPFLPTRNVARSITSNAMFYYIIGCLMITCKYFSMPQTKFGPIFNEICSPADIYHPDHEAKIQIHNKINSQLIHLIMRINSSFVQREGNIQESIAEVLQLMHVHDFHNLDQIPLEFLEGPKGCSHPSFRNMIVSTSDAKHMIQSFSPRALEYNFTAFNFTGGQRIPRICGVCKEEGHLKDECPEEKLPPLAALPKRTQEAIGVLDKLCIHVFEKWKQNDIDILMREEICIELQNFIREVHPTAKLELFGSTKNGFGLKGSDMDICLTFEDNVTGEGLDTRAFIEVLYRILRSCKAVTDLLPISTAKVPIVKFTHKATKLDGDISLYNVLAMENSRLLSTYAKIDIRAQILGYMMKRFSKVCDIGDASKGSLSSYAYSLLVIFFLQHCDPPVLPVLQELHESNGPPPKHIVEGCNAYFFEDLKKLGKVWPGLGKNNLSVGELWLNLLVFYTEQFDMLKHVVSIRCSRTVTKFEKLWISKGIAIEDPFDLSHNLGSALTRKMSLYIIKAFRKGRNHFGQPVKLTGPTKDIEAYYLNVKDLTEGELPNDRGCRICKSIGHKEKNCPEKKKRGRGKQKKKEFTEKRVAPVRKIKNVSDDEDDNEEDDEDDDNDSQSDLEEEKPKKIVQRTPENVRRAMNSGTSVSRPTLGSPSDQRNKGFQSIPPGFIFPEANTATHAQFTQFKDKTPPRTQNMNPKIQKVKNFTKTTNAQMTITKQMSPATTQTQNNTQMHIPTIVFSNSKLVAEPIRSPVSNNNAVRYSFPPGQETSRPPPGFSLAHNSQRFPNSVPFPQEQKQVGPNKWNFEGVPFYAATSLTSPRREFINRVPVYASPPTVPLASGTPSPRPSVSPAFNNLRFGMLGATEQMIWGPTFPTTNFRPSAPERTSIKESPNVQNIDAAMSKLNLSTNTLPNKETSSLVDVAQEELKTVNVCPNHDSEQNDPRIKPIEVPFLTNSQNILNSST